MGAAVAMPRSASRQERQRILGAIAGVERLTLRKLGVWRLVPVDELGYRSALDERNWTAAPLGAMEWASVPLATARLRGGVVPDNGWANIPTQPAVITGTVDQVGSRLLFRSYGCSSLVAPIHAALVAHDSLIILDEAHCAHPFRQTASAVCEYLDSKLWTTGHKAIAPPLRLMIMTATPPPNVAKDPFPAGEVERDRALDHAKLRERRDAKKLAKLELTKNNDFVRKAGEAVQSLRKENPNLRRIAVMVNRVQSARDIFDRIKSEIGDARIELLTGQLRPLDRDKLVGDLQDQLKSGSTVQLENEKPIVLVTTQCLEVGADFDFDALVTECASLDALLQRFGRLDRLGDRKVTKAIILARVPDVANDSNDFVYGEALKETWGWLKSIEAEGIVDFGIGAMHAYKRTLDDDKLKKMLAPVLDAPVLMPAHLDLLCQTAPRPEPDPDVAVFLHGLVPARPEVLVAFRADLPVGQPLADDEACERWVQAMRLAPPLPSECLTIPIHRFRAILRGNLNEPDADVEAAKTEEEMLDAPMAASFFVVWRYGDSFATDNPRTVRPGDTIIFPADIKLAQAFGITETRIDRADEAYFAANRRALLRIHPLVLGSSLDHPAVKNLLSLFGGEDDPEIDELVDSLKQFASAAASFAPDLAKVADRLITLDIKPRDLFRQQKPSAVFQFPVVEAKCFGIDIRCKMKRLN
jgi:CRISPR-associated endonuclease/helicase Cas3